MTKAAGRPPRSDAEILEFRTRVSEHAMSIYRAEGFEAVSMRRLSKRVGCAPTTLYAHFAGKTEILMLLWADVLSEMAAHVRDKIQDKTNTADSLAAATYAFVTYWRDHPDDFRLVFMSSNVGKTDVDSFIKAGNVDRGFAIFKDLLRAHDPGAVDADIDIRSETLVAGMIGVALCLNTISGYAWPSVSRMTDQLLAGIIAS